MSTCKGKRDRQRGNTHTRKTGETSDGAVVRLVVCLSERVEANPKKRGNVGISSLRLEGRAAARRLGLLSNGGAK